MVYQINISFCNQNGKSPTKEKVKTRINSLMKLYDFKYLYNYNWIKKIEEENWEKAIYQSLCLVRNLGGTINISDDILQTIHIYATNIKIVGSEILKLTIENPSQKGFYLWGRNVTSLIFSDTRFQSLVEEVLEVSWQKFINIDLLWLSDYMENSMFDLFRGIGNVDDSGYSKVFYTDVDIAEFFCCFFETHRKEFTTYFGRKRQMAQRGNPYNDVLEIMKDMVQFMLMEVCG